MSSVYISDLNGTLLRNDATLSDFAEENLRDLLAEGLLFTVASARSVDSQSGWRAKSIRLLRIPLLAIRLMSDWRTGLRLCGPSK